MKMREDNLSRKAELPLVVPMSFFAAASLMLWALIFFGFWRLALFFSTFMH
jgi:hypothetical protein